MYLSAFVLARRALLALVAAVVLSGGAGCAGPASAGLSDAHLRSQLQPYASLEPFEFVRRRFFEEAQSPVLDKLESAARDYSAFVARLGGRTRPQENGPNRRPEANAELGLVTWPAYFNERRYEALLQPMTELRSFCGLREGQWQAVERYAEDPVAGLKRDPLRVYLEAQARVSASLRAQDRYAAAPVLRDVVASNVGAEMAEEAALANQRIDASFSTEGFRYAVRLGGFGAFECQEAGQRRWWVSILPSTLQGRDLNNNLDSSMARLAIRVVSLRP